MIYRHDIINHLIHKFDYESYLEIGVDNGRNFSYIEAPIKWGVAPDPEASPRVTDRVPSDEFFDYNLMPFDIIFIDGLHEADQAYRDVENALKILNPHGTIVMHDCSPPSKASQTVPRIQDLWCGDVWRAWMKLRQRDDLFMEVVNTDYGVGIIRRKEDEPYAVKPQPAGVEDMTYSEFNADRAYLLNLVPPNCILGEWTHD